MPDTPNARLTLPSTSEVEAKFGPHSYESALANIVHNGTLSGDRTGTGTIKLPGQSIIYSLEDGVMPLLTSKRVPFRLVFEELMWFLRGSTDIQELLDKDVHIWDEWRRNYTLQREWEIVPVKKAQHDFMNLAQPNIHQWVRVHSSAFDRINNPALKLWNQMMDISYTKGIHIAPEWCSVDTFVLDLENVPQYHLWKANPDDFVLTPWYGTQRIAPGYVVFCHRDEVPGSEPGTSVISHYLRKTPVREKVSPASFSGMVRYLADVLSVSDPHRDLRRQQAHLGGPNPQDRQYVVRPVLIDPNDMGPIYGENWRSWRTADGGTVDQIANAIHDLRTNPTSRRILVSAWNPGVVDQQALPACHALFQFLVSDDNKLDCILYQRSADMFLGVPFNIASYALLTHMVARITGLEPHSLIWFGGDCHVYQNHVDQVATLLSREPRELPTMVISGDQQDICDFSLDDFDVVGYNPHPVIKAPVSV